MKKHPTMQFFAYEHLPKDLQYVSRPFSELADVMNDELPDNQEKAAFFRKLLEAKDAAVRAKLFKPLADG